MKINVKEKRLRFLIRKVLRESLPGSQDKDDYQMATEKSLMLDREGMEKSQREKIRDYLSAMGIIKHP